MSSIFHSQTIFESPDKGLTIYARQPGSLERIKISSNGNVGIGTTAPSMSMTRYNEWADILDAAETNPAVKIALEQLRTTYYLSKDNGGKT